MTQTSTTTSTLPDPERLQALLGTVVTELGAVPSAGLLVLGQRLGLFDAIASHGPCGSQALADATGTDERYVREWSLAMAAAGYVDRDASTGEVSLCPEQRLVLLPGGPVSAPVGAATWLAVVSDLEALERAFRSGDGIGWHQQHHDLAPGVDAFFRPGYEAFLTTEWLPALDGVVERLEAGARVLDVATGHGSAPLIVAAAYPLTHVLGVDYHRDSVVAAREAALRSGLDDRVEFEVADATDLPSIPMGGWDLVTTFDALHDLPDPGAVARRVREVLSADGTWMVVEPAAGDDPADNLHPVGRFYYAASTFLCVPNARWHGGTGLGAQAGEGPIRDLAVEAGFNRVSCVARTPFNAVYEIRP